MNEGQLVLAEQLQRFRRGIESRAAPADVLALWQADAEAAAVWAGRPMLQAGSLAPEFALLDQHDTTVRLADRLTQGPVVLVFSRGGWCPFCTLVLRAWQDALPALHDAGGDLLAILPERVDACSRAAERDLLAFPVLSDPGSHVAETFGLVAELPDVVRPLYVRLGHDLPRMNGTGDWRLPVPSTVVIGRDGRVVMAHADPLLSERLEPAKVINAVRRLA